MKLHPRHVPVEKARKELVEAVSNLVDKYQLTFAEELSLLSDLLSQKIHFCIKVER